MDRKNLGFGCVSLTRHSFLKDAEKILSKAFLEGITHFDTAPLYGNGYSEKILGKFINNKRRQVTVTTKCGLGNTNQPALNIHIALLMNAARNSLKKNKKNIINQPSLQQYRRLEVDYVKKSLEKSLQNLHTDYIDYYLLHEALPFFLSEEALAFLKQQQQKGVIRELGLAAAYINLESLSSNDLDGFNTLQYENGPHYKTESFLDKFSNKKHFFHSALKSIPYLDKHYVYSEWAGILLNRAVKINPSGKILFSTTKSKRLAENLTAFDKFSTLPLQTLNNMIDGIH